MSLYNFLYFQLEKMLGAAVLLLVGTVQADCNIDFENRCSLSRLQIGANYTRANIKVPGQSCFDGNLGGLQGSYEYQSWNGFYGGLRVSWKQGRTENSHASRCIVYVDIQERIGYTFVSCLNNWSATVFSGFGYRYLNHRLKEHNESAVKFRYNEFYVPVGFLGEYFFSCNCSLGLNLTWMPQVYPTVEIKPLKGARWVLTNTLGNVIVELPLTYYLSECRNYSLIIKPFYEYWEDGKSTAKTSGGVPLGLPRNTYQLYGVELNIAFSF